MDRAIAQAHEIEHADDGAPLSDAQRHDAQIATFVAGNLDAREKLPGTKQPLSTTRASCQPTVL